MNIAAEKKNIVILFGGQSTEHEVSCLSAANIVQAIDKKKYSILLVGITKEGSWYIFEDSLDNLPKNSDNLPFVAPTSHPVLPIFLTDSKSKQFYLLEAVADQSSGKQFRFDLVFPVLHGLKGEDGTLQGMLDFFSVPYLGCGMLASGIAMQKSTTNLVLAAQGINSGKYVVIKEKDDIQLEEITATLGFPLYVKPNKGGSSVGINRVTEFQQLTTAINEAFRYDNSVIIEQEISGKEVECGVLELPTGEIIASTPGEIEIYTSSNASFYDYHSKYLGGNTETYIPARLDKYLLQQVQETAVKAFKAIGGKGFARVDFFIDDTEIIVNEINTIPGFTNISLFPKMFEQNGIAYSDLVELMLEVGLQQIDK